MTFPNPPFVQSRYSPGTWQCTRCGEYVWDRALHNAYKHARPAEPIRIVRGQPKTEAAAAAAYDELVDGPRLRGAQDAVRELINRKLAADLLDDEMRIRAELIREVAVALADEHEHQTATRTMQDRDFQPFDGLDMQALATAAVDRFAEYYREHQNGTRR